MTDWAPRPLCPCPCPYVRARRAEEDFFGSRHEYRDVVERCGTHNLARNLNHILVEHIK